MLPSLSSHLKELYNPKAFFTHAAWLDQSFLHCPIFLTAASRRSLVRVSVPVWGIILSDPLLIVDLVSLYLTNYLIRRGLILGDKSLDRSHYKVLASVSRRYSLPKGIFPRVTHPCATHPKGSFDLHVLGLPPAFVLKSKPLLHLLYCCIHL